MRNLDDVYNQGIFPFDIENIQKAILVANTPGTSPASIAVSFMYQTLPLLKGILQDDWISYDVVIGKAGEEITALNLIRPVFREADFVSKMPTTIITMSDLGILARSTEFDLIKHLSQIFSSDP
ncbi:unnamed protein product [Brugia pahangi]|uniref:Rhabdo_ncap domain-containing protein n=1 Tax=Brugia pahangi TaxID=6280 RepID=A0A0N4T3F6_BRUPA|nr:unnamed protein product [Brugia pahangi]